MKGIYLLLFIALKVVAQVEDRHGVKLPSKCEVCKILAIELKSRFKETESTDVIQTGHGLEKKKSIKYDTSELRLTEVMEDPHICEKLWEYQLHKERKGSNRFAKGTPQTFQTLKKLSAKGVTVKTDVPEDLWDQPSAETSSLYKQCGPMVSDHEAVIEDWYFNRQEEDLTDFLCRKQVLKDDNSVCLDEVDQETSDNDNKTEL